VQKKMFFISVLCIGRYTDQNDAEYLEPVIRRIY